MHCSWYEMLYSCLFPALKQSSCVLQALQPADARRASLDLLVIDILVRITVSMGVTAQSIWVTSQPAVVPQTTWETCVNTVSYTVLSLIQHNIISFSKRVNLSYSQVNVRASVRTVGHAFKLLMVQSCAAALVSLSVASVSSTNVFSVELASV